MWQVGFILFFLSFIQAFAKNPSRSPHEVGTSGRDDKIIDVRKRPQEDISSSSFEQKEIERSINQLLEEIHSLNSGRKPSIPTN